MGFAVHEAMTYVTLSYQGEMGTGLADLKALGPNFCHGPVFLFE